MLTLELQYALQYRHDARGAALTPRIFGAVAGWARNVGVESLLDHGDRWWKHSAVGLRPELRGLTLAFLRYARNELQQLRERESGEECWEWDTWPVERVDPDRAALAARARQALGALAALRRHQVAAIGIAYDLLAASVLPLA